MDTLSQAADSVCASGSESVTALSDMPNSDQRFLLFLITVTYFGPDVKEEKPRKSVSQRSVEKLPLYTADQLAGSFLKVVEIERIYNYILRKADSSIVVKSPVLHSFILGNLPTSTHHYPQFTDLFLPQLHPYRFEIIENIAFINDPDPRFIKTEDLERFKSLTGLENLLLNRDAARFYTYVDSSALYDVVVQGPVPEDSPPFRCQSLDKTNDLKRRRITEHQPAHVASGIPVNDLTIRPYRSPPLSTANDAKANEKASPGMIFLPSYPNSKDWRNIVAASKSGFALTGTAAMGQVGPIIGPMDIGESDDAYLFRVSLPGVKKDDEFSCGVEKDGKVTIKGVTTTGESTVYRFSQMFEMQSRNLCPPGQFSVSFYLPGPVNPQQFTGNKGTDGILEGIVMKKGTGQ